MNLRRIQGRGQTQWVSAKQTDPEQQGVAGIVLEGEGGRGEVVHAVPPIG
jgi:hypothetical protein